MKLIHAALSPFARKCRVIAIEAGIPLELIADNPADPASIVAQHNPLGKVPALLMDDGSCLFDSTVIVDYLAGGSASLIPSEFTARIAVKKWEALADGICDAAVLARQEGLRKEQTGEGRDVIARQRGKIDLSLKYAARELADRTHCVGAHFTLADAAMICALAYLSARFPDINWRGAHPNLARYMDAHASRKSVAETRPVVPPA